jgi:peptidyl-tRNA hydrolase
MGQRKVVVKQSAAENIAAIAWDIESKGMVTTAEKLKKPRRNPSGLF